MSKEINPNPFLQLFGNAKQPDITKPHSVKEETLINNLENQIDKINVKPENTSNTAVSSSISYSENTLLEKIFLVTLNDRLYPTEQNPEVCLNLGTIVENMSLLSLEDVSQVVFERLLLSNLEEYLNSGTKATQEHIHSALEPRALVYLFQCFYRAHCLEKNNVLRDMTSSIFHTIATQAVSVLSHGSLIYIKPCQDLYVIYSEQLSGNDHLEEQKKCDAFKKFINQITQLIDDNFKTGKEEVTVNNCLKPTFDNYKELTKGLRFGETRIKSIFEFADYLCVNEASTIAFLEFNFPEKLTSDHVQRSILGRFISLSCLPNSISFQWEYFKQISSEQQANNTEYEISVCLGTLIDMIHQFILSLLKKSPTIKLKTLQLLKVFIKSHFDRNKLWSSLPFRREMTQLSDGFMINLQAIFLKLAQPFCIPNGPKLQKINPLLFIAICKEVTPSDSNTSPETCLIPLDHVEAIPEQPESFITEIFFLAQKCCSLSFSVVYEWLNHLSYELSMAQQTYIDARNQAPDSSPIVEQLKNNYETCLSKLLSAKSALLSNESIKLLLKFHIAAANWLHSLAMSNTSSHMSLIPEYFVENIANLVICLKRFHYDYLENEADLQHLFTLILEFMGSPDRMFNPHLRAKLAMMLDGFIPPKDTNYCIVASLFSNHPMRQDLVPTLLHVFVSIETTGQSVSFEQKFQYRNPMYNILRYLWAKPEHQKKMISLAKEAEENIEATDPPLFLRFINLLINDAIYLLDEALEYMTKIREIQIQETPRTREQDASYQQMSNLARFHNVMSNETISTLNWLSQSIKSIFCHPTIVDRITAMLNHFLLHLVGPKKKNLKVKDFKAVDFKPHQLLKDISMIYLNLGVDNLKEAKHRFCIAISQDGRSYSKDLFKFASDTLIKIGEAMMSNRMEELATKIHEIAAAQKAEDEMLGDIPEEFLDPIINSIMKDPVILPSSRVVVDRSTIARHLLSDQSDPFNREPLTMDMLEPNTELLDKINEWLKAKRESNN